MPAGVSGTASRTAWSMLESGRIGSSMVRPQSYSPKLAAGTTSARPSSARSDSHAPASRHCRAMSSKVPRGAIAPDSPGADDDEHDEQPGRAHGQAHGERPPREGGQAAVEGVGETDRQRQPHEGVGLVDVAEGDEGSVEQGLGDRRQR